MELTCITCNVYKNNIGSVGSVYLQCAITSHFVSLVFNYVFPQATVTEKQLVWKASLNFWKYFCRGLAFRNTLTKHYDFKHVATCWSARVRDHDQLYVGSLSTRVFETRTATGSKQFSLLTCPHTTTFTLLSIFSPLKLSSIKIREKVWS